MKTFCKHYLCIKECLQSWSQIKPRDVFSVTFVFGGPLGFISVQFPLGKLNTVFARSVLKHRWENKFGKTIQTKNFCWGVGTWKRSYPGYQIQLNPTTCPKVKYFAVPVGGSCRERIACKKCSFDTLPRACNGSF